MEPFTRRMVDLSTSGGYQFEFHCDRCDAAFQSTYQTNKLGIASSILGAATSLFSGTKLGSEVASIASAGSQLNQSMTGKARADALETAIAEVRSKLRQCSKCGKWVCPQACWDEKSKQCTNCVSGVSASKTPDTDSGDVKSKAPANAPADAPASSKFCSNCGKPLQDKAKFCADCGTPRA
jgi:hypothetical protein